VRRELGLTESFRAVPQRLAINRVLVVAHLVSHNVCTFELSATQCIQCWGTSGVPSDFRGSREPYVALKGA